MSEVVLFVLGWIVSTATTFGILILDERSMGDALLERAWPPVSRNAAVCFFGPLALPVHFIRTRRNVVGILLGVGAVAIVAIVSELVGMALEAVVR